MRDYPFTKCLNPKQTQNPYTRQPITVRCGKCMACKLNKNQQYTLKCKLESKCHKYTKFVGLTYAEAYVPRCVVFRDESKDVYVVKDDTKRFSKYSDIYRQVLCEVDTSPIDMEDIKFKVGNNRIHYLCKKDLQLFIKRLRKQLSKYSDEKIRYYAVGEYGPVHFRPHFHLLVWFTDEKINEVFNECLDRAWRFGRTSSEDSRGKCASYTAGYVNSDCNLPKIFMSDSTKPFCTHSAHLGESLFMQSKAEVYNMDFKEFSRRSVELSKGIQDIHMWSNIEAWYFPKCRDYARKSLGERSYAYTIYREALEFIGEKSPYRQARFFTDFILNNRKGRKGTPLHKLLMYFQSFLDIDTTACIVPKDDYTFEKVFRAIYHDLYVSKHFCCNLMRPVHKGYYQLEVQRLLRIIDKHYIDKDKDSFAKQMEYQDTLLMSDAYTCEEVVFADDWNNPKKAYTIPYFYDNVKYDMDKFSSSRLPKIYHSQVRTDYNRAIKHRELNDANDRFKNK